MFDESKNHQPPSNQCMYVLLYHNDIKGNYANTSIFIKTCLVTRRRRKKTISPFLSFRLSSFPHKAIQKIELSFYIEVI